MKLSRFINKFTPLSIRKADKLVISGNVKVNNKIILEPYYLLKEKDKVNAKIDHKNYQFVYPIDFKPVYYAFYKPKCCEITLEPNKPVVTLLDYLKSNKIKEKVFYIGRLDFNSTGLLLLTNDGKLANQIIHPSHNIFKTYFVKVKGKVKPEVFHKISNKKTIIGKEIFSKAVFNDIHHFFNQNKVSITTFYISLSEGKNRHIHRLFEYFGYVVISIKRTAIGKLYLNDLGIKRGEIKKISRSLISKIFSD